MRPVPLLTSAGFAISIFFVCTFALLGMRNVAKQTLRGPVSRNRAEGNALYLSLLFLPAAILFLKDIVECTKGPACLATFLIYANFFYGLPTLYLFMRGCCNEATSKPIPHFIPALVNLPFAVVMAQTGIGSIGIDGELRFDFAPIPLLYINILAACETFQLVLYARLTTGILNRSRDDERVRSYRWLVRAAIGCYAAYYGVRWFGFSVRLWYSRGRHLVQSPSWIGSSSVFLVSAAVGIFGLYVVTRPEFLFPMKISADKPKSRGKTIQDGEAVTLVRRASLFLSSCEDLDETNVDPRRLADHLGVPYYRLSQAVNEIGGLTIADLIRAARVDRAKALLVARPDLSIIEIAFDAGFPAKSSFNEAFKKVVGMKPREYRRLCRLHEATEEVVVGGPAIDTAARKRSTRLPTA